MVLHVLAGPHIVKNMKFGAPPNSLKLVNHKLINFASFFHLYKRNQINSLIVPFPYHNKHEGLGRRSPGDLVCLSRSSPIALTLS